MARWVAEDVRYYGELLEKEAFKKIGYLYPPVKVHAELGGGQVTAIAYLWVRNVKCPNPACGCEMPLTSSFFIAKTEGREIFVEPTVCGSKIAFSIHKGKNAPEGTVKRSGAKCICCGQPVVFSHT